MARENANIIRFQHDRVQANLDIGDAVIHVVCEVSGKDHGQRLLKILSQAGYQIFRLSLFQGEYILYFWKLGV